MGPYNLNKYYYKVVTNIKVYILQSACISMVNQSKKNDARSWDKWKKSGAIGNINGRDFGEAYAFFDCDALKQKIEKSEPQIRSEAKTPKGLQMLLNEGISGLQLDKTLAEQIQYPDDYRVMSSEGIKQGYTEERRPLASMKYVLVANYRGASNEDVANELGDVINVIHRKFNKDQGIFSGAVVYEKNGEYQLRE